MTDQDDASPLKEAEDEAIALFAQKIFGDHVAACPRCDTDGQLCRTGQELQLIQIDANDGTLPDGGDVNTSSAWAAMRAADMRASVRGNAEVSGIERIREALMPLGIFGNSNDPGLIVAVIGGFVERYKAEEGALQEALDSLGRLDEQHHNEREALYTERTRLVVALAGLCRLMGYDAGMRDDPAAIAPWKRVLLIDVPDMPSGSFQASWHIAEKDLALTAHLPEFPMPWNGHTTGEKYERLRRAAVAMGSSVITPEQKVELQEASSGDRRDLARSLAASRHYASAIYQKDLTIAGLEEKNAKLAAAVKEQTLEVMRVATEPIPMRIVCEKCGNLHIDKALADKPHSSHQCEHCGLVWKPSKRNTVGVQYLYAEEGEPWFEKLANAVARPTVLERMTKESP